MIGLGSCAAVVTMALPEGSGEDILVALAASAVLAVMFGAGIHWSNRCYYLFRRHPALLLGPVLVAGAAYAADEAIASGVYLSSLTIIAAAAITSDRGWTLAIGVALAIVQAVGLLVNGYSPSELYDQGELAEACGVVFGSVIWGLIFPLLIERLAGLPTKVNTVVATAAQQAAAQRTPVAHDPAHGELGAADGPVLEHEPDPEQGARLTPRQIEVVALLRDGLKGSEVATQLGISVGAVYRHVHLAKERVGAQTRDELIAIAIAARILPPLPERGHF